MLLAGVAIVVAAVLLGLYLARWARHRDTALADLRPPVLGPLFGTLRGGLLVLDIGRPGPG